MPTSSQFKIINILDQKRNRQRPQVYRLSNADEMTINESGTDESRVLSTVSDERSLCPKERFPPMTLPGVECTVCVRNEAPSRVEEYGAGRRGTKGYSEVPTKLPCPEVQPRVSLVGEPEDHAHPEGKKGELTLKSHQLNLFSPNTTNRLYCLGFRCLPEESATERKKIEIILNRRPAIAKKPKSNETVKDSVVDFFPEGIQRNTEALLDFSCIDPKLLLATALCFDATGVNITHQQLKTALHRILFVCPGVKITKIQYDFRKLKDPSTPNRWMIYTDSQLSRNLLSGRWLDIAAQEAVQLRRYDDLVLLAFRQERKANAWKHILGEK